MAIEWQTLSLTFGSGPDTKSDPKTLQIGKLAALQNGRYKTLKRVTKRNGYTSFSLNIIGGGSLSNPNMLGSFGSRQICAASASLYDYSTTANAWKNAGKWDSIKSTNVLISSANQLERNGTLIVSGNYGILTYDSWLGASGNFSQGTTSVYASLVDLTTNTTLSADVLVSSTGYLSRPFVFGDGNLGIFYIRQATAEIYFRTLTISGGALTVGAEIGLFNSMRPFDGGGTQNEWYSYDVVQNGNNAAVVSNRNIVGAGSLYVQNVSSSGSTVGSAYQVNTFSALPLHAIAGPDGNIWIYWASPASHTAAPGATTSLNYTIISPSGTTFTTLLGLTAMTGTFSFVRQISAQVVSATLQKVYFSTLIFESGADNPNLVTPTIYLAQNNTSGTFADPFAWLYNMDIFGRVFTQNGNTYLPVVYPSVDQNTGHLVDVSDKHAAAKFLYGQAESAYYKEVNGDTHIGGWWWRYPGFITTSTIYNSTHALFGSGKIVETFLSNGSTSINNPTFYMGSCIVNLEWNNIDAFQSIEANSSLILNGSVPCLYDGNYVSELGFLNIPEIDITSSPSGSGNTYSWYAIYQWFDSQGNIYQSAVSDPITFSMTGDPSSNNVGLTVKTPAITQKSYTINPIQVVIYRTVVNGTIPYFVNSINLTGTSGTINYTDKFSDSQLNQDQPLYTNGGAIVGNSAPPPSMIMWLNNNRLWMVDSEDQTTWYAKTFSSLGGVQMSDLLTIAPDTRLGNIIAGQAMDEKTIILKEQGITIFVGDGADDSGSNSTLSLPQIIPSDVGASNSKAVILFPGGILFRSANNKGIYLISRGTQVEYIGADVEAYNSQDIQDMQIIPNTTEIRLLTSSGSSLFFDYLVGQWGWDSNRQGLSSAIWNGTYIYARTDGSIYQESATNFLDSSTQFVLSATTAWIKASAIQGFQRVRRVSMLGDYASAATGYSMQIAAAYDFSQTFQPAIVFNFATQASTVPYQYRERLPIQKCDTLQLQITENPTGASGQFIDFTDLGIEIGMKRGLNKLPPSQSVG